MTLSPFACRAHVLAEADPKLIWNWDVTVMELLGVGSGVILNSCTADLTDNDSLPRKIPRASKLPLPATT